MRLKTWADISTTCRIAIVLIGFLAGLPSGAQLTTGSEGAPALTERERQLLDKIEQLEKRVFELESKAGITKTDSVATNSSQQITNAPSLAVQADASAPAKENVDPPEPFAFADFTWLNGTA